MGRFGLCAATAPRAESENPAMSLVQQIDRDMIAAMKAHDTERTSTLRMAKAALKNREIEKREALTDAEAQQVFGTMIKQRRESIEIVLIESYLPKTASDDEMQKLIDEALAGQTLTARDIGPAMKAVQARVQASGFRADGRRLSELVKARLGQ
jgi:uncharacterized protein YqeY